jgi:hypothetical protein
MNCCSSFQNFLAFGTLQIQFGTKDPAYSHYGYVMRKHGMCASERVDKYAHAHYALTDHYSRRRHHTNIRLLSLCDKGKWTNAFGIERNLKFRPPRPIQLRLLRVVCPLYICNLNYFLREMDVTMY